MAEPLGQLYVGDLSHDITEPELFNYFATYGKIIKISIVRKDVGAPHQSAYAFIAFDSMQSAQKARAEANGTKLKDRNVFVMIYNKEVSKNDQANIFIKNLPPQLTPQDFEKLFQPFGTILSSKISYDFNGVSRGYGFIQYSSPEEADLAVKDGNSLVIGNFKLTIEKFTPKDQRIKISSNNIYVRGFPENFREEDLANSFESFGKITSKIIMRDSQGNSRLFGFVCFENRDSAGKAVEHTHGKENSEFGFTWFVNQFMSKTERLYLNKKKYADLQESWKKRNLIVTNLPNTLNEYQIRSLFQEYGQVDSLKIETADNFRIADVLIIEKKPTGRVFVCFKNETEADTAFDKLQHLKVNNETIKVRRWKPRTEIIQFKKKMRGMPIMNPMMMFPPQFMPLQQNPMMQMMGRQQTYGRGRGQQRQPFPTGQHPHQHQQGFNNPQSTRPQYQHQPKPHFISKEGFRPNIVNQQIFPVPYNMEQYKVTTDLNTKKQIIGEAIYNELFPIFDQFTGKITGMLIEIEQSEIVEIMKDKKKLREKANEAMLVLKQHLGIN